MTGFIHRYRIVNRRLINGGILGEKLKDIKLIVSAALEKKTPKKRSDYLDEICGDDTQLRVEVESLHQAHDKMGDFLKVPALETDARWENRPLSEGPGTVIGRYKLVEEIGQGGMGVVYLAEQAEPVQRKVALKIIKLGMDTKQVIARFEIERQALALMDHPNIAKVLDAGATETGQPYFVMELVKGMAITEFCDSEQLSTRQRLELFIPLCQAVQHAHQKGIIHRDIKPSNVLVTLHDDRPVPQIIDFGIAKATSQRLTEKTLFTRFAQLIGTPEYMSPEQAEMGGLDIDTRTDIYSLGILLYELLAGTTPLDPEKLHKGGYAEIQRIIREEEPSKPSTKLSTLGEAATNIAKHRKTNPEALQKIIRGDLDWVVMKALEKEPARRYSTAAELAADIDRHLNDEPVLAAAPSVAYVLRKFVRRNRPLVTGVIAVLLVLLAGVVSSTIFAVLESRARNEAVRARELSEQRRSEAVSARQKEQVALQKEQAARIETESLLVQLQMDRGLRLQEEGDRFGLLDLLQARITAGQNHPLSESLSLLWTGWYQQWANRLVYEVSRTSAGAASPPVKISANWQILAALWDQQSVRLWDASTGAPLSQPLQHKSRIMGIALSPDGSLLATGTADGTVQLWDTLTGQEKGPPQQYGHNIRILAFSPDAKLLIIASGFAWSFAGTDNTAKIWNVEKGEIHCPPLAHNGPISRVTFNHDGSLLATGSVDQTARIWQTSDGKPHTPPLPHTGFVLAVEFSHNGSLLATGALDGAAQLWDTATAEAVSQPLLHDSWIISAKFSPDDKLLATISEDGAARLWETATGDLHQDLLGGDNRLHASSFSPDGELLATGAQDGTVRLWRTFDGERYGPLLSHWYLIEGLEFSPDGKRLVTWDNRHVLMWNLNAEPLSSRRLVHDTHVQAFAFSDDGKLLATGSPGKVKVWDLATAEPRGPTMNLPGVVKALAFAEGDKKITAISDEATVHLWDTSTGEPCTPAWPTNLVAQAAFSHDGKFVVTVCNGIAWLWGTEPGMHPAVEALWDDPIYDNPLRDDGAKVAAINPDGKLVAIGVDWNIWLYDTSAGQFRDKPFSVGGHITSMGFSEDSKLLAVATNNISRVLDIATAQRQGQLIKNKDRVRALAFSPDTKLLATAEGDTVRLWNLEMGPIYQGISLPHPGAVYAIAFSPDGRFLVTGSEGATRIWRLPQIPDSLHEMELRTWIALAARNYSGRIGPISWQ